MAAYFDTGFSVREPMWHGEGLVLDDYPVDWNDARAKAGLAWEPLTIPGYNVVPASEVERYLVCAGFTNEDGTAAPLTDAVLPDGWERLAGDRLLVPAGDRQGIVRSDTFGSLGNASDQFSLIYHSTMGEIMEALTENGLRFETAGSCREGRQVWALGYLDEPYTVPGDDTEHLPFMALLNNHDGSGACKVTMTQVRVVCWNTFQAASAEGDRTGRQFSFRHVGDVMAPRSPSTSSWPPSSPTCGSTTTAWPAT
jgi:phage/plasmid-like protein (TIGR03299 family)